MANTDEIRAKIAALKTNNAETAKTDTAAAETNNAETAEALLYLATGRSRPEALADAFDKSYCPVRDKVAKLTPHLNLELSAQAQSRYVLTKYPELEVPAQEFSLAIDSLNGNFSAGDLRNIGKNIVSKYGLQDKDFDFNQPLTAEQEKAFKGRVSLDMANFQPYSMLKTRRGR